jgi:hypothetical protein
MNENGEIGSRRRMDRSAGSGVQGEEARAGTAVENARVRGAYDANPPRTTMADQPQARAGEHRLNVGISHQAVWGKNHHRALCSSPPPGSKLFPPWRVR